MHKLFQPYDVLRFDSTVVINLLMNISSLKLNNQFFFSFQSTELHECVSGLTSTSKAELFFCCKPRKFIGQNKVKMCKV